MDWLEAMLETAWTMKAEGWPDRTFNAFFTTLALEEEGL